jgi:hypothetical protein
MKKLLLFCILFLSINTNAQVTLFEDSFEDLQDFIFGNGDIGNNWYVYNVDGYETSTIPSCTFLGNGASRSFQVFNPSAVIPPLSSAPERNLSPRTGNKSMASWAAYNLSNPSLSNNDFLISPQITLGPSENIVSFWAKSSSSLLFEERFIIGVSTTTNLYTNFTPISIAPYVTNTSRDWIEYTFNLDAYANQAVYISINCVSNQASASAFLVDDFKVTSSALSTNNFTNNTFKVYPNPISNELNIDSNVVIEKIEIVDINGRILVSSNQNNTNSILVNTTDLKNGIYLLKIASNNTIETRKIIKK